MYMRSEEYIFWMAKGYINFTLMEVNENLLNNTHHSVNVDFRTLNFWLNSLGWWVWYLKISIISIHILLRRDRLKMFVNFWRKKTDGTRFDLTRPHHYWLYFTHVVKIKTGRHHFTMKFESPPNQIEYYILCSVNSENLYVSIVECMIFFNQKKKNGKSIYKRRCVLGICFHWPNVMKTFSVFEKRSADAVITVQSSIVKNADEKLYFLCIPMPVTQ